MEGLNPILPQSRYLYPLLNYTEEDYTAPAYEASKSIFRAHGQPRFGHNDDFGDLLSGESEQQKDYFIGVISIDDSLANMSDDLRTLVELTENLESSLYVTDIFFYIMIAVTCFLVSLVVAMMIGVWFSAKNVSNCFTRCIARAILWPLFVFFLLLFWTFSAAFLVATLAGADFCIAPDDYVALFLKQFSDLFDGLLLGFVIYYISGCTIIAPGTEALFNIATQITVVAESSHNLVEKVGGKSTQDMIDICGLTEKRAEALLSVATMLHSGIHVVDNSLAGLREILACSTLNPIYVTMVHNAVCVESVNGLVCIFSTTLVISVFSMWMILFRAALYPVQEAPTLSPLLDLDTDGQVIDKSMSG